MSAPAQLRPFGAADMDHQATGLGEYLGCELITVPDPLTKET